MSILDSVRTRRKTLFDPEDLKFEPVDYTQNVDETLKELRLDQEKTDEEIKAKEDKKKFRNQTIALAIPAAISALVSDDSREIQNALANYVESMSILQERRSREKEAELQRKASETEQIRDIEAADRRQEKGGEITAGHIELQGNIESEQITERAEAEEGLIEKRGEVELEVQEKLEKVKQEYRLEIEDIETRRANTALSVQRELAREGRQHDIQLYEREMQDRWRQDLINTGINADVATRVASKMTTGETLDNLEPDELLALSHLQHYNQAKTDSERTKAFVDILYTGSHVTVPVRNQDGSLAMSIDRATGETTPINRTLRPDEIMSIFQNPDQVLEIFKATPAPNEISTTDGKTLAEVESDNTYRYGQSLAHNPVLNELVGGVQTNDEAISVGIDLTRDLGFNVALGLIENTPNLDENLRELMKKAAREEESRRLGEQSSSGLLPKAGIGSLIPR